MGNFPNIHTAYLDRPLLHIIEAWNQAGRCTFAGTGFSISSSVNTV